MVRHGAGFWLAGALALWPSFVVHAQSPEAIVQQTVDAERAANRNDHSHWIYFEKLRSSKEDLSQWVATTPEGDLHRVLESGGNKLSTAQQRERLDQFLHNEKAQKKSVAETAHDEQQVDDLLSLLPKAFRWTLTDRTEINTVLHYDPSPDFHPPTREARVFSSMTGDLIVDNRQHRVRSLNGHLLREVSFGGGILGKLKEGSSFSLEQLQASDSLWQLSVLHVHLEGNALLFKSISLQQDTARSRFAPMPATHNLGEAGSILLTQPD